MWNLLEHCQITVETLKHYLYCYIIIYHHGTQTLGMIAHRLGTLLHIIALTPLGCGKSGSNIDVDVESARTLAKEMASLKFLQDGKRFSIGSGTNTINTAMGEFIVYYVTILMLY